MTRALIDTNVIMDVLFEREKFLEPAKAIWKAVEEGRLDGYISAITPITVFYVAERMKDAEHAHKLVEEILAIFRVCPLTEASLHAAMALPMDDYEDAAQVASAIAEGLDVIVTRDVNDYAASPIPALSPVKFLKKLG